MAVSSVIVVLNERLSSMDEYRLKSYNVRGSVPPRGATYPSPFISRSVSQFGDEKTTAAVRAPNGALPIYRGPHQLVSQRPSRFSDSQTALQKYAHCSAAGSEHLRDERVTARKVGVVALGGDAAHLAVLVFVLRLETLCGREHDEEDARQPAATVRGLSPQRRPGVPRYAVRTACPRLVRVRRTCSSATPRGKLPCAYMHMHSMCMCMCMYM